MSHQTPSDQEWEAIKENVKAFDGIFWYAVATTKIFCRPSCPSRLPKKEHVSIFYRSEDAEKSGYRPCKRCRPTDRLVEDEEWAEEIETILQENYRASLSLEELGLLAHGSESHMRHVFQRITGQTPHQRLLAIRLERAHADLLLHQDSLESIALRHGFSTSNYFIRKYKQYYGETPKQARLRASKGG